MESRRALKYIPARASFLSDEDLASEGHLDLGVTNMKTETALHTLAIIFGSALLGVAQIAQAHQCTVADAAGTYGHTSTGAIVNPAIGPFTAVGHVTFTESGTLNGGQTTSIAGNLVEESFLGNFTVNPDCTGSAIVYVYHGSTLARTSHLSLVWDSHQNEVRAIFLTPGTGISITARKMDEED